MKDNTFDNFFNHHLSMFEVIDSIFQQVNEDFEILNKKNNYPRYNLFIVKREYEDKELKDVLGLEVGMAGFKPNKIKEGIEFKNNILSIKVDKFEVEPDREYLEGHRGLAFRGFEKYFRIPFEVSKVDIDIEDGVLRAYFYQSMSKDTKINFK